jgi:hypothetical protein
VTASYDLYNTKIEVQWTDGTGETGYGIWRHTSDAGASATYVGAAAANATNYSDTSATPGVEYFYWVRATNSTSSSQSDLQANGALGRRLDPNLPIVTTDDPTEITQSSAKGGGNVTDAGGAAVTERGVVWGTGLNPTTAGNKSAATAGGTGTFTNFISGLIAGESYFVRAYASNSYGVAYGANRGLTNSCFTNAPGAVWASATNYTDFTAAWSALGGAATYRIDVSTSSDFTGGGLADDFADGNFSANPAWSGDTSAYLIITDATLPGGSAATDSSFLGVNGTNAYSCLTTPSTEVSEWSFSLGSTTFNPSSGNYFGVVLMASAAFTGDVATNDFQGYYLKIGVDGSTDYIELWRKTGVGSSKVGNFSVPGNFGTGALDDGLNIAVTRNASGEFTLYYSTGFTYGAEPTNNGGTLTNAAYDTSSYFGVYGRFADNGTTRRIYFDNFATGGGGSGGFVPGYEDRLVSSGTSTSVTGLTEETTYYFRVRAESPNCESDNSPTGSVTTGSSTVEPPDEFSAAAAGVDQIDLAFTANAAGDNVVVVYNLTGSFEAPSGVPPALGEAFAGGTLIYNGTGSSYNHTGLDSCTLYYYRAFSYAVSETFWSDGSDDNATTATPGAPTTIWASATNYADFTATWDAVAGAAGYFIDVSETTNFAASGGSSTRMVLASNAATSPGAITNDWSGYNLSGSSYVAMIQPTSVVTSPAFSTVGFTNLTVDFRARSYGGTAPANNVVTVSISTNNGVDWTVVGTATPPSSSLTIQPTLTNTTHLGFADTRIRWQTLGASGSVGAGVDRLVVQGWQARGARAPTCPATRTGRWSTPAYP